MRLLGAFLVLLITAMFAVPTALLFIWILNPDTFLRGAAWGYAAGAAVMAFNHELQARTFERTVLERNV